MNKKILLIGLVFLLLIASAFATLDDADGYWALEDLTDMSGNGNDLTNYGTGGGADSGATGIIDDAYTFVASNSDYMETGLTPSGAFTLIGFINYDTTNAQEGLFTTIASDNGAGRFGIKAFTTTSDTILMGIYSAGYKGQATSPAMSNGYNCVAFRYTGTQANVYVDKVAGTPYSYTTTTFNNQVVLGRNFADNTAYDFDGVMDEFAYYDRSLSVAEMEQYCDDINAGTRPYGSAPDATGEIFPQVIDVEQPSDVEINSNTYQSIYQTTFQTLNDTPAYTSWTVGVEAVNKATEVTCRATIDGTDYSSEVSRTLANGEAGVLYLYSDEFNITNTTDYDLTLECKRNTNGAKVNIYNSNGLVTFQTTLAGEPINHLHGSGTLNINSTSFQLLASQNFTTSDLTSGVYNLSLVTDGSMVYNYDSTSTITVYAEIEGTNSSMFERGGSAGSTGSGAGISLIQEIPVNETVTINFYGKSTTGDGSVDIRYTVSETLTHKYETDIVKIPETSLTKSATWTTLETLYINNSGHTNSDILTKASITASDSTDTCQVSFRLKAGTGLSTSYTRDLTNTKGVTILEHVFSNPGLVNQSIELQTINDCGVANTPTYSGGFYAQVADQLATTPQFYTVQARDIWDNSSITDFNVTLASGTLYQSNATGYVTIYHVNGLDDFTTTTANYFDTTKLSHDTTTSATSDMRNTDIKFIGKEILTLNNVSGTINISTLSQATDTSFYLKAGTYEATISSGSYFTKSQNFTVTALQNETLNFTNLGDSLLKINATNAQTGSPELAFNFSFQFNGTELDTYEVTTGEVNISLLQGYNYTIFINDSLHALQYFYEIPNVQYYNTTLVLSEVNSILFTFYDEITGQIINGTNMTALLVGVNSHEYTTTSGSFYANLITPESYEVRYYSTIADDYKLRSAFFTLSPLSFQNLALYSLNSSESGDFTTATITFSVFDTNLDPVEGARVVVQRYYSDTNGYASVWERNTDTDGLATGVFETVDAFYKYSVYYNDNLEYTTSNTGTQFTSDKTIPIYIDTSENYGESIQDILDLQNVTTLEYVEQTNTTGYFDFSFTNDNNIQLCLNVVKDDTQLSFECQTTSAGTITHSIDADVTGEGLYIASVYGYDPNTEQHVIFDQKIKEFATPLLDSDALSYAAIFISVFVMIGASLLLIKFPVAAIGVQAVIYLVLVLSPINFLVASVESTVSFVMSLAIVSIFIIARGKNE